MALFDWLSGDPAPAPLGQGVTLRAPVMADYPAWATLRTESQDYLQPWEPTWPEDDLTRAAFRRRLAIYERERELATAWPFFIFRQSDDALLGAVTLSNIRRGVADTGTLGYWIARRHAGSGFATAAVRVISDWAFTGLELHRIEAACLPENLASRRVLEKNGFALEGRARAYLKINGAWADHLLFGLVNDRDRDGAGEQT